ncbi:murein L,D-transpeptidase [Chitinophaga silvatica]|uniref:Murein L,D-transpeptidase n=1 Tax=Chitinophaga silvatica TaxID=2282649 RepID=A0A3E1YCQ7_9BACT|nr:L,D-transpeptidase family protein [Chitinophaga silvatica]RFS24073.1 murein L,D-transpeptidase [Chitinophaga silvatica]
MTIRFYGALMLLMIAFASCMQQSGSHKKTKARDTSHYTKQAYIDLTFDSSYVHKFLQDHPSYNAYDEYILNFYRRRDFHYAWINKDGLTEQAGNFINMMKNDAAYGIGDSSLIPQALDTLLQADSTLKPGNPATPGIELLLTAQFFAYGNKVWGGLITESAKDLEWFIPRKKIDMESLLDSMIRKPNNTFEEDEPVNRQYTLLKQQLKRLVNIASKYQWDTTRMTQKALKKGDSALVISQAKNKLQILGDLSVNDSSNVFNAPLDTALRSFQERMGLKTDGVLNQNVLNALNVPVQQRIQKVLLNMERLRWVPIDPTSDHIVVNIPQFKMMVYDSGRLDWSCNVVVGKPGTSTVVFTKELRYIVFSPYWNVPPGILTNEVLPGLRKGGSSYLARQNMEIVNSSGKVVSPGSINLSQSGRGFPYTVRQKPGGKNSLGKVKFLFPNEYNIYLHDTPARYLFGEDKRSFSHGCIRIEEPKHLAMWLLRDDPSWTEQKIDEAMNAGKEKYVTIKDKVPVYIVYFTAFVDEKNRLNFRDDVYNHDAKLASTLFAHK